MSLDVQLTRLGSWAGNTIEEYTKENQPLYKSQLAARTIYFVASEAINLIGIAYHSLYILGKAIPATVKFVLCKIPLDVSMRMSNSIPDYLSWGQVNDAHLQPLLSSIICATCVTPYNALFKHSGLLDEWMRGDAYFAFPSARPAVANPAQAKPTVSWSDTALLTCANICILAVPIFAVYTLAKYRR